MVTRLTPPTPPPIPIFAAAESPVDGEVGGAAGVGEAPAGRLVGDETGFGAVEETDWPDELGWAGGIDGPVIFQGDIRLMSKLARFVSRLESRSRISTYSSST